MKLKRILASFVSIAMILTMLPTISFAQLTTEANGQKAKVEMVLLTKDESGNFIEATTDDISKTAGSIFYMGLRTKDFNNIYEVANFTEKTSGASSQATNWGLNTICLGISFNSEYLILEPDKMYWDDAGSEADENYAGGFVPGVAYNEDNHAHDPASFSEVLNGRAGIIPLDSEGNPSADIAINQRFGSRNTKRQYTLYKGDALDLVKELPKADTDKGYTDRILITADSPANNISFPWSGADSVYLGILQFGFKKDATDLADGTSLMGFSTKDFTQDQAYNNFTFGGGTDSNKTPYSVLYEDNTTGETGDYTVDLQDVRTVIDFIEAPLFPKTYTITYDANPTTEYKNAAFKDGVTEAQKQEGVKEGQNPKFENSEGTAISSLLVPPENMMFDGWYTASGTRIDVDPVTFTPTEPTTLYAHYKKGYNVNFHLNGDGATYQKDGTSTLKYIPLGENESPAANAIADTVGGDPERAGYTFKGWYTMTNGAFDTKYTDDGAAGSIAITTITSQTDLYAMWDNEGNGTYKLNFNNNPPEGANNTTDADPKVVGYNNASDTLKSVIGGLPVEPTTDKEGYEFLGWYKNVAGDGEKLTEETELLAYTGATTENKETTVYAKWGYVEAPTNPDDPDNPDDPKPNANTVTITFPSDAGSNPATYNGGTSKNGTLNNRYIKYGETVSNLPTGDDLTAPTNKGFGGWYTMPQNANGTTPEGAKKVEATTQIDSTFNGVTEANGGTVSLYAYWVDNITLAYDVNGLPGATKPADQTVTPGKKFTPYSASGIGLTNPSDYKLKEWNTEADGSGESFAPDTEANVDDLNGKTTLYAIWNYDETKDDAVTITFDGNDTATYPATLTPNNGGSATNKYSIVRQATKTVDPAHLPTAKRTAANNEYTFNHWDTNKTAPAGGQGTIIATADEGTKTMTVYAIWTVTNDADKRTVTFKKLSTDEDADAYATVTVAKGDTVGPQMPANPTRDGYTFNKWLQPDGTTEFTDSIAVNNNMTVVADWTQELELKYDKNGLPDAVKVPATEKGAPGTSKTVGNITANGEQVKLVEWNTEANGTGTSYQPDATITFSNTDPKNITLYAIWDSTDPSAKTIKFLANDSTQKPAEVKPHDTNPADTKVYTMKRMPGTIIAKEQMPTATRGEDYTLDHWGKTATEAVLQSSETQEAITVGSEDVTRYAIWKVADGKTKYSVKFALHGATSPTNIADIEVVEGDSLGDRMPADPERTDYIFNKDEANSNSKSGWTTGDAKANFTKDTAITSDMVNASNEVTVDANWLMKVDVKFTKVNFPYDGNAHTPLDQVNGADNYAVMPEGTTVPITGKTFTLAVESYQKVTKNDDGSDKKEDVTGIPTDGGTYTYKNPTLTETGGDGFTSYQIVTITPDFKITAKDVELTIDKNYQYIGAGESIADITVTANPNDGINTAITGGDIKVTFTDKDNATSNTMPTALGKYTIKIEAANGNYNITKVKDNYTHEGDAIPLYLINLQRQVKVDYLTGTNKHGTDDVYATVTLAKPTVLNKTEDAKTTLANQTPALDVPQQGTDFDPPTGMRIKKFVTGTKQEDGTIADQVDFDKDTVISFSENNEALTIYAIYENADWTLKFVDTKTDPAAETFDNYTVDAEKSVKVGLKKKGTTDVTNPDEKTLPAPTAAPQNQMFLGWTTTQAIANEADLTSADFNTVDGVDGKHKGKLFTDDTVPTPTELAADSNTITVYAVYVKSSDATLKSALFKEILVPKDDDGNPTGDPDEVKADLPYVDTLPTPTNNTVTFDPGTNTYNIIVKNDFDKVLADLEPTQPGATIAVKVNNNPVANETTGVPAGHTQAKPSVDATVYNETNGTNSTNTIVVTVTAPDGSTEEYTFNVLRYVKPRVELMPGNSPYGLIEAMHVKYFVPDETKTSQENDVEKAKLWDDTKIADAKTKFVSGTASSANKFKDAADTPKGGKNNITYTLMAWGGSTDEAVNMDRNPYAIFAYNARDFEDTGFKAYDSLGRPVNATNVKRSITVNVMKEKNIAAMKTAQPSEPIEITGQTAKYTITELKDMLVCPGKYSIEYSFEDPNTNENKVWETRNLVVVWGIADADMSGTLTTSDAPTITKNMGGKIDTDGIPTVTLNLYKGRIVDADMSGTLTTNDAPTVSKILGGKVPNPEFYR